MAFTAKILSWRFRHLNIEGCLLKRRPTKGGSRAPQDPPPPTSYAPEGRPFRFSLPQADYGWKVVIDTSKGSRRAFLFLSPTIFDSFSNLLYLGTTRTKNVFI